MARYHIIKNVVFFLVFLIIALNTGTADNQTGSTIEIINVSGGYGNITVDIKNTGNEVIRYLEINISIKGGILNQINKYHNETTCVICNEALNPNDVKTITTSNENNIFGFGIINIDIYAKASNTPEIQKNINGFVIGYFVFVP